LFTASWSDLVAWEKSWREEYFCDFSGSDVCVVRLANPRGPGYIFILGEKRPLLLFFRPKMVSGVVFRNCERLPCYN
jgi:hypothetical protein